MDTDENIDDSTQTSLLDLNGKEFNVMWVDESAPLFVANNPLHWKAHKFQILAARLEKQAEKNPAQFNSKTYMEVLNELERIMKEIINGKSVLESRGLGEKPAGSIDTPPVGEGNASCMDTGISTDNPIARQGSNTV
jgi:hypothetical protein